jgi:hypothetical protein
MCIQLNKSKNLYVKRIDTWHTRKNRRVLLNHYCLVLPTGVGRQLHNEELYRMFLKCSDVDNEQEIYHLNHKSFNFDIVN